MTAGTHQRQARLAVTNEHSAAIASFIGSTRSADIPPDVREHARWDILDTIGCALFGQTLPIAEILRRTFRPRNAGPAQVWGDDWTTNAETAALVNGTLVHSFELDDLHARAIIHPGGVTLPALLAVAGERTVTGADLVTAHVVGLEVSIRVGLAVGQPLLWRGWHNNGVLGVFGSSAGVANLRRLTAEQSLNAIGIAGSLASGLMAAQYGAMVKRMHAGQAAQSGLRAALLAEEGFTGIRALFEEPYGGYVATLVDSAEPDQLSADLGQRWETTKVGFKPYAACGSSHTTVDVLRGLRATEGLSAEDVDRVRITASTATRDHVGWPYIPESVTTAQMNLPYAAAVTLLFGDAFVDQFDEPLLRDPRILELTRRVEVTADPEIDSRGRGNRHEVRIEVETRDGRVLHGAAVHARGSGDSPLTREEREEKFLTLAGKRLGDEDARRVMDTVLQLDDAPDVTPLLRAVAGA